jgi:hypothetical protein
MFRNSSRDLITPDKGRSPAAAHDLPATAWDLPVPARELPGPAHEPARGRWKRARRHPDGRPAGAGFPFAICPKCRLVIRDQVAIRAGYCGRCQDFTLMCAAGRRLVSPDVTTRTSWHWPCTAIGTARWQVSQGRVPIVVLLCAEHAEELAAGRVSWIEQPTFMGAPSTTAPL